MKGDSVRLLTTGDIHLGRHPTRIPNRLDGKEFSPRSIWQDVVREAIEREVDAVVITGDVADRENRYFEAYGAFESGVIDLDEEGIPIVTVAGNHDSEFLPRMVDDIGVDNLHLLGRNGTWERFSLGEFGDSEVYLDGWSFPQEHVSSSPIDDYDLPQADQSTQIGVLHADLDNPRTQYAPVDSSELRNTPADCWLLGHIHVPQVPIDADPTVLYPGSPQPLDPGEQGVHGPWLISIEDGEVTTEQIPTASVRYEEIEVDVSDAPDIEGVGAAVSTEVQQYIEEAETRKLSAFLPRIKLTGRTDAHAEIEREKAIIEDQLVTNHGSIDIQIGSILADTRPDVDLEDLQEGENPVSYLAELLLALEKEDTPDEFSSLVDESHDTLRRAYRSDAYNPLRREGDLKTPERATAKEVLESEARVLLDTLLQQTEGEA